MKYIVWSEGEYLLGFRHVPRMTSDIGEAIRMPLEQAERAIAVLKHIGFQGELVAVLEPVPATDGAELSASGIALVSAFGVEE